MRCVRPAGVVAAALLLLAAAEAPGAELAGGSFPALVAADHRPASGLVVFPEGGLRPASAARGRASVPYQDPQVPGDLARSVEMAGEVAARTAGRSAPLRIVRTAGPGLAGLRVSTVAGAPATVGVWDDLRLRLLSAAASGAGIVGHEVELVLEDGETLPSRVERVSALDRRYFPDTALAELPAGSFLAFEHVVLRLRMSVELEPAPPSDAAPLVPEGVHGSSAGLAYALSFLNVLSGGVAARRPGGRGVRGPAARRDALGGVGRPGEGGGGVGGRCGPAAGGGRELPSPVGCGAAGGRGRLGRRGGRRAVQDAWP